MPEIPDIEAYLEALRPRLVGEKLLGIRLASPFLLRTVDPPLAAVLGGVVLAIERLGKRLVFEVDSAAADHESATHAARDAADPGHGGERNDSLYFLVLHLMIAGRLHWKAVGAPVPKGGGLAAFDFTSGTLILTEAGKKRRASLRVVRGREALAALDPGGIDVQGSTLERFTEALKRENHTLKRALTDPKIVNGIGNAYSDEILHRARLSPFKQTRTLDSDEIRRLHAAAQSVLQEWTDRLCALAREQFPEKVTAFRTEMGVHGRYGEPCPVCGAAVRRIVYADNECDYCPVCQTEGRLLADRSLSRLLKDDWPRTVDEADALLSVHRLPPHDAVE